MKCKEIESLLLDYVYGLPEGDELQGVEKHLAQCANCQNALNWVKGKKTLIMEATVEPWDQVRFDSKTLEIQDSPQVRKKSSQIQFGVWAALAALVLIQVVPVWLYFSDSNSNEVALVRSIEGEIERIQRNPQTEIQSKKGHGPRSDSSDKLPFVTVLRLNKTNGLTGPLVKYHSITLNRSDYSPVNQPLDLRFILIGPEGEKEIAQKDGQALNRSGKPLLNSSKEPIHGFAQGSFELPKTHAPENWSLEVRDGQGNFDPVRLPIEPRKNGQHIGTTKTSEKDIVQEVRFDKESYLLGDKAVTTIQLKDANGIPLANQKVTVNLFFSGKPFLLDGTPSNRVRNIDLVTSNEGQAKLEFIIPMDLSPGENKLVSQVPTESFSTKTVPIPVQR